MTGDPRKKRPFADEELRLLKARKRFFKRTRDLFDKDGVPKKSPEEFARRMEELQRQFEATARQVERRAEASRGKPGPAAALKARVNEERATVAEFASFRLEDKGAGHE